MSPTVQVDEQFILGPAGIRDRDYDNTFDPGFARQRGKAIDPATQRIMIYAFILGPAGIRDRDYDNTFDPGFARRRSKAIDPATQRIMIWALVRDSGLSAGTISVIVEG